MRFEPGMKKRRRISCAFAYGHEHLHVHLQVRAHVTPGVKSRGLEINQTLLDGQDLAKKAYVVAAF